MLVFRTIWVLLLFLSVTLLQANDQDLRDSLEVQLASDIPDSTRSRLLFDLAEITGTSDTMLVVSYLERGREIAGTLGDNRGLGRYYQIYGKIKARSGSYEEAILHYDRALAYFNEADDHYNYFRTVKMKGNVHLFRSEYNQAMNLYQTALDYYRRNDIALGISRCLNNMGIIYKNRGDYVEALAVYNESAIYLDSVSDAYDIAQAYINMGNVFVLLGSYNQAMDYFQKSLAIAEQSNFRRIISLCLTNSGVIQNKIGNYEEAKKLYQRSMIVSQELNDPIHISNNLINMGTNYSSMGELEQALDYVNRGMEIKKELEDDRTISNCYIHLADIHSMMGEEEEAVSLYIRAIPVKEELGDQDGLIRCYLGLGSIALEGERYQEARQMAERATEIAEDLRAMEYLTEATQLKMEIADRLGNYRLAYDFARQFYLYRDSLMDEATSKAAMELEFRSRSRVLQQEVENLRIQSDLDQMLVRKRTLILYSSLVFVSLLALSLILVIYFMRRHKNAKLKLEEKNLVITRQNMKLDQVNKTKDRMMSIIAHDLRGTIGNQITAVEVLKRIEGENKVEIDRKRLLGNLKNSASYSLELLENLLHWSRLEGGESNYHPEEVKLNTLITNCLSLYNENINNKDLDIKKEIEGTFTCAADRIMMETVYRNLISNAIKFSNPGGAITIALKEEDGLIHFRVSDEGIGMSEELIRNIESNSGGSRRGTANEKGAGMGLRLVRDFTHLHNGKLLIKSEAGKGSTFEVIIPCIN